jgi:1,2-dihydroxy-3-keto-5-methylthiopentene dioxygenase
MHAYYYDNLPGDQRLPHDYVPSRPVSLDAIRALGVNHWCIPVEGFEAKIDAMANERGYKNRDVINITKEGLGDAYEDKIRAFFQEHLHEDEEIRYILSGSGFFDVRGTPPGDAWIRIAVEPGDMLVIPAGIYHRFTLDEADNIRALRLFKDEPKWTPYNRSAETDLNPYRVDYLRSVSAAV